jgi:phosphoglycerate kinase
MNKVVINRLPIESLRGKRVFVRIDASKEQSFSSAAFDDSKLRSTLPTLEYLMSAGSRIIIGTHLGNPAGRTVESLRLDPLAGRLSDMLDRPVRKLDDAIGVDAMRAVTGLREGEIVLLENLRFYPGEDTTDAQFARKLAELGDLYCNDAFALAHRGMASTVGITRYLRPAAAGLAMARELMMFEAVLDKPEEPFLGIIAGARLEEKLPILENLLPRINRLFIGGALAFTFYRAKWLNVGAALVDEAFVPLVEDLLEKAEKKNVAVILPEDFMVVREEDFKRFQESEGQSPLPGSRHAYYESLLSSDLPVDIGPGSLERLKALIESARTIFWNGPLGIWEVEPFASGTREVARVLAERVSPRIQRTIICGDSLSRAIQSFDLPFERLRHLTTGGESALQLLAGNPLPAVAALDNEVDLIAPVERRPRIILLAVDGSEHSLEAVGKIGSLVDAKGAEISLVYVQKPMPLVTPDTWIDPEIKREREIERRMEAERVFAEVNAALARQGLISHMQITVEGDPADEILRVADEIGAALIAMGSHGKSGVLSLIMGSVSRKVVNQARRPVLIVKIPDAEMVRAGLIEA